MITRGGGTGDRGCWLGLRRLYADGLFGWAGEGVCAGGYFA